LSATVAQVTRGDGVAAPALQLLIYPVTDLSSKHPSYRLFADGFLLTEAEMDWYRGHYLPDESAARDPRASPLLARHVDDLAPAIVLTAGFDVLRDEGEAYARRLQAAGVATTLRRSPGLIHGLANVVGVSPSARRAMLQAAGDLAQHFARCGQAA
jgi:acetyl esterase